MLDFLIFICYNINSEREVNIMIKCPNCGSSAQVKLNDKAVLSRNGERLSLGAECSCGCQFSLEYEVVAYDECDIITIERKN